MMIDKDTDHITLLEEMAIGYENGQPLLNKVNLSIRAGEMVALIGRNGTGKSTLLKSMIGLVPLLGGTCYLDGTPLQMHEARERARRVSYVSSQVSQLPPVSVLELVALGRMPHTGWLGKLSEGDRHLIKQALIEVQLESFVNRKLDHLSDGERQRAMIARAFVQNTPLMVLDEPTAFLDIPNKYELIRLLMRFRNKGKSIVYSTHDLETAMMCADKLWVIHGGKIIEGAPEDLGISGIFNTLFDATGITFDEEVRRFKYTESPRGSINLAGGPENAIIWTRSALARMGYEIKVEAGSILRITKTELGLKWNLSLRGKNISFDNILDLSRFLIKDN